METSNEPSKKPTFVRIGDGLGLGYRRNRTAGTWVVRVADGLGQAALDLVLFAGARVRLGAPLRRGSLLL